MSGANVCIVQHGEKEPGRGDRGLTALGHAHAAETGRYLASAHWDGLYSSPLRRAQETANSIGENCDLVVTVDERLRERMNWGGGPLAQDASMFLADWAHASEDRSWVPPGGDSSEATGQRMHAAIEEHVEQGGDCSIIVVSHAGATADLLRTIFGDATLRSVAPSIINRGIESCALTRLRSADGRWQLLAVATRRHLAADHA